MKIKFFNDRDNDQINVLGLMSGTSGDGIDGALVKFDSKGSFQLLWHDTFPFSPVIRRRLQALMVEASMRDILRAKAYVAELYADAVKSFRARHDEQIDLLAAHGQTLDHDPNGDDWEGIRVRGSLQVLDAAILAERTGLPVTYDFRSRDMAAGGQGAPLVPFGDLRFFGPHCRNGLAVLNIGGIANLTVIRLRPQSDSQPSFQDLSRKNNSTNPPDLSDARMETRNSIMVPTVVSAFDTGPGNMMMDALAFRISNGLQPYDKDGNIARSGRPVQQLLASLLEDSYLALPPPKSTGRDLYGIPRENSIWRSWSNTTSAEDLMATYLEFTVESIARAIEQFVLPDGPLDEVIVAGGGALNSYLISKLSTRLQNICPLQRSDTYGVPVMAREAMAFAALGDAFIRDLSSNVPAATGARHAVVLGAFVPG